MVLFSIGWNIPRLGGSCGCGRPTSGEKRYDDKLKRTYWFGAASFDDTLFDEFSNFKQS
jgi:hypothetical protein